MALVGFNSSVNMLTVATPSIGGFVIGYDSDGVLKQKNGQGVITPIAGVSTPGSLSQTLAKGNNTGEYSISLGQSSLIRSSLGGGQLRLDNGQVGRNIVNLSTDYGVLNQSYLLMSSASLTLKSLNASLLLNSTSASFQLNTSNIMSFSSVGYSINLNSSRVLFFTTGTSSTDNTNKAGAIVSSSNSRLGNGANNTVILGGNNIIGATANSVYVPNLYVKDGGFIKGTSGVGQLTFNYQNEVFLTSNTNIIGILEANSAVMSVYNGIFITDNIDTITTTTINSNTFISTSNTTVDANLTNVIVIGGDTLSITQSNTTYIGGPVSIGNAYVLPSTDGSSGQVIKTDGSGNTYWGPVVGSLVEITAASFSALNGTFETGSTYKILDANSSLYGGTEIYLTTNASGILNETGVGKFYNPKYGQTSSGFDIFKIVSYLPNVSVFWGGKAWIRNSATYSSYPYPIDEFTLNSTYWNEVPFNDPFTQFYYNIAYDEIKYDWQNDLIIYRNEKNSNIVSSSVEDTIYWIDYFGYSPIKVFQWGNIYDFSLEVGVGNNIITNSYNNNINFKGKYQLNLTFDTGSYQNDLSFDIESWQSNIVLRNFSRQVSLSFSSYSYQNNLVFNNSSYQDNLIFTNDSYQGNLIFNKSYHQNLTFDNSSFQSNLTFNNSNQIGLLFDGNFQLDLTFNNSNQGSLIDTNGYSQNSIKLDNYSWNRTGPMTSDEKDLTLNGNKVSYQTPFGLTNSGIGEVVFFGTTPTTLDPGYIYQFTAGEWLEADLGTASSASGLLAIALGEYVSDGLLLRGYATFDLSPYSAMTIGSKLYLDDNGTFIQTPTTTSGEIVRVIGYCVDEPISGAGTLYFCPDTTWIEII